MMLVCQNDCNPYQFTVVFEDLSNKPDGQDETSVFDSLPGPGDNNEQRLAKVILAGIEDLLW